MKKAPLPGRNFGNKAQYGFFHLLLRAAGTRISRLILALVVLWYTVLPHGRKRAVPYLERRFGPAPFLTRLRQVWNLQHRFGVLLLERLMLRVTGKGGVLYDDAVGEKLKALIARGKGLIVFSAHVGGWQGAVAGLRFLDKPVNILQYRADHHGDQHFFRHEGEGPAPVRIINVAEAFGGMVDARAALARGEVVCMMGDRLFHPKEPAVDLPFLGKNVRFPVGGYRMAALANAPIAVLFVLRGDHGPEDSPHPGGENLYLHLAGVIEPEKRASRAPEAWKDDAAAYVALLEGVVREHPYQFFNFYDMWQ